MTGPVLIWADELLGYNFGPGHPMDPRRLALTRSLIRRLRLPLTELPPVRPTRMELERVHEPAYLDALTAAGTRGIADEARGLGASHSRGDTPVFPGMDEAAALMVGSTLAAVRAVDDGVATSAFSLAGGMHHAMPGAAAGFCILNDAAVAIADHLARGGGDVLYIDVDAHHGDGVEACFRATDRVTTISLHQHPRSLFPHTGYPGEVGDGEGRGHALNVALPESVDDGGWVRAVEALVMPVARELRPSLIVSQHGADTHRRDPLADLAISVEAQYAAAQVIGEAARRFAGGRWVALGGGGYDVADAVPRAWTAVAAAVAGVDLDLAAALPEEWRQEAIAVGGGGVPRNLGDGVDLAWRAFERGHDPASDVDRAILAARQSAFPLLGLDPVLG